MFYQVRRYMDHLSDADLEQRAIDIFVNRARKVPPNLLAAPTPTGWEGLWLDVVTKHAAVLVDAVDSR